MAVLQELIPTMMKCPFCDSEAFYRYGRTKTEKQRFRCLICNRQFSKGSKKLEIQGKPICSECGKTMHLYKIEGDVIRFRCSNYPSCRTFKKYRIKEEL